MQIGGPVLGGMNRSRHSPLSIVNKLTCAFHLLDAPFEIQTRKKYYIFTHYINLELTKTRMLNAHSKLMSIPYNNDILSVRALCLVFFSPLLLPSLDRIGLDPILDRGISAFVVLCRGGSTEPAAV